MALDAKTEAALLDAVRQAARQEILPRFRRLGQADVHEKTNAHDLVTEADIAAEAVLTTAARSILPDAVVVGEEAVAADASVLGRLEGAGTAVILDPVDGTWNFAKGLATFGVILAVVEQGETVFGLLYDPVMDDWVLARRGGGTWYGRPEGQPVRLSTAAPRPREEMTGFLPMFLFPKEDAPRLATAMMEFGRMGSLRCACHEYRLLAQGHADLALSATLNPWDHAAGVLAVIEAGGAAALLDGRPYRPTLTEGLLVAGSSADVVAAVTDGFGWLAER